MTDPPPSGVDDRLDNIEDIDPSNEIVDGIDISDLCFRARALAQTHPMTEPALRYRQTCFEAERERQHVSELADWSSTAFLVGYCLRRTEELVAGAIVSSRDLAADSIAAAAAGLGATLRTGDAASVTLLSADAAVTAIDRIIGSEIHKRQEHLREQLDNDAWAEFEGYVAWWVVHGYCVRAVETSPL